MTLDAYVVRQEGKGEGLTSEGSRIHPWVFPLIHKKLEEGGGRPSFKGSIHEGMLHSWVYPLIHKILDVRRGLTSD